MNNVGTATMTRTIRHENIPASQPPAADPIMIPIATLACSRPIARMRCAGGKLSATSACEMGEPPASPSATPQRVNARWTKPCAVAPSAVIRLHTTTQIVNMMRLE